MNSKWPKCPKCQSPKVELIEMWTASISWEPEERFFNEGILVPGDPIHVEGYCQVCDYRWRIRGVTQVQKEWFEDALQE